MSQRMIFTDDPSSGLKEIIEEIKPSRIFFLADSFTRTFALGLAEGYDTDSYQPVITIARGDTNKNLDSLADVWSRLAERGANRRSILVNTGGGMVTDLGGFAAATFKRGIPFINIPTTLLGAVDAAAGGKTGINFHGLKNEIGVFREAEAVVVSTKWYSTLPRKELLSGYAEMVKHALLTSAEMTSRLIHADPRAITTEDVRESVEVKRGIVAVDPTEKGLRRALNLGHTAGHAIEELALRNDRPVPHGYAVAWGLVVSLVLSRMLEDFPAEILYRVASWVKETYGTMPVGCNDYETLLDLMGHDKKNTEPGMISFTLLSAPGAPRCGVAVPPSEISAALDIARDLL